MITRSRIEEVMAQCIAIAEEKKTPFGAALVNAEGQILKLAANTGKADGPLAHAEMNVLRPMHHLADREVYLVTTCEPCPMCAAAAVWSRVSGIYFGASIKDAGKHLSQIQISCEDVIEASWQEIGLEGGVLRDQCLTLFAARP